MKRFLARHSPLVILAGLCLVLAALVPDFGRPGNLQSVAYRTSVVGMIAVGQTLVVITGGIDLSVGSVAALSGVVSALLMTRAGLPVPLGVVAGCLTGLLCGLVNGLLTAKGRMPAFIATLGMMMAARGAALLAARGVTISNLPASFLYLGGTRDVMGLRGWWIPVALTLLAAAVVSVILGTTRFGRAIFAVGGNATGARLSGVAVDWVRIAAFATCGLLTGFAGVLLTSRTSIADPSAAEGMELDAIAACVIGGASLMGGEGGPIGSLAGALIMNVLVNVCNLKHYDVYWQLILIGGLIVLLVYYDSLRKRRAGLLRD